MSPRRPEWWPAALDRLEECTWEFLPEVAVTRYENCLLRVRQQAGGLHLELSGPEPELLSLAAVSLSRRFPLQQWQMWAEDSVGLATVAGPGKLGPEELIGLAVGWRPDLVWRRVEEGEVEAVTPEGMTLNLSAVQRMKIKRGEAEDTLNLHGGTPVEVLDGIGERLMMAAVPPPAAWLLLTGVLAATLAAFLGDGPWLRVTGITACFGLVGSHLMKLPMARGTRTKLEILLLVVQALLGSAWLWGAE